MPTKISSTCFPGGGGGTAGRGVGSGDRFKLATIRARLKRTHNIIENRIAQEQKERYAEIILDRQAREAKLRRGETILEDETDVENNHRAGIVVEGGDYEGLMMRQGQELHHLPSSRLHSMKRAASSKMQTMTTTDTTTTINEVYQEEARAYTSLEHPKWSLSDALLLYGTLEQVQHHLLPSHYSSHVSVEGEGWTQMHLDNERTESKRRIDANTRTSLHRLYIAYDLLERAARALELYGGSFSTNANSTFRQAVTTLIKFVIKNDGLRIRGMSSGGLSSLSTLSLEEGEAVLSLSLLDDTAMPWSALFDGDSVKSRSSSKSRSKSTSPSTILHRLRQYASLGSAILYLAAKSTGVGRTLTEICSAFGTFAVLKSTNNDAASTVVVPEEPLVRPKYCSRAMQELREALPDVVASLPQDGIPIKSERETLPPTPFHTNHEPASTHGQTPIKVECIPETPSSNIIDHCDIASKPISVVTTEEAALVDLTTRMANSLGLPPIAIHGAIVVAMQCARDALSSPFATVTRTQQHDTLSSSKRCNAKAHIRPSQRSRKRAAAAGGDSFGESPDVIAISSILLTCTAGGTMQRLASQAVSCSVASSTSTSSSEVEGEVEDLNDDLLLAPEESDKYRSHEAPNPNIKTAERTISTNNFHRTNNARVSWEMWNDQPQWHRDITQMEHCAGIPRKLILSFYSKVIHPRRLFFLGAMSKLEQEQACGASTTTKTTTAAESTGLLHNIVAAAPLMSLRNLG